MRNIVKYLLYSQSRLVALGLYGQVPAHDITIHGLVTVGLHARSGPSLSFLQEVEFLTIFW